MASVFDVAKYVLEKVGTMTAMKLQKLVYYCQAWSLAWDDVPLFDEDFQAWANGPVCPELYRRHRGIFRIERDFFKDLAPYGFTDDEKETMDQVILYYGDKEPHWLSELTHRENPWKNARIGVMPGERSNRVITKESMQEYYSGI